MSGSIFRRPCGYAVDLTLLPQDNNVSEKCIQNDCDGCANGEFLHHRVGLQPVCNNEFLNQQYEMRALSHVSNSLSAPLTTLLMNQPEEEDKTQASNLKLIKTIKV